MIKVSIGRISVLMILFLHLAMGISNNFWNKITSISFLTTIIIYIIGFILNGPDWFKIKNNYSTRIFVAFMMLLLNGVFFFAIHRGIEGYGPLLYSLISFFFFTSIELKLSDLNRIFFVSVIILISMIIRSYNYYDEFMTSFYSSDPDKYLNSDVMGALIGALTILVYILSVAVNTKYLYRLLIILGGIAGILGTASRGALFELALFTILLLVDKAHELKKSHYLFIYNLVFTFGILFPLIFIKISEVLVHSDVTLLGKGIFSGREAIWMDFFNLLKRYPLRILWGFGEIESNELRFLSADGASMHNWYLKVIFSAGILGLLIFYFCFRELLRLVLREKLDKVRKLSIFALYSFMMLSVFENNLGSYTMIPLEFFIISIAYNDSFVEESLYRESTNPFKRIVKFKIRRE